MRVVTRRTGLSPDVLRVWERRYGVVQPARSEGGQRLYSAADLERLRLLNLLVRGGHRIAALSRLPDADLARLAAEVRDATGAADSDADAFVRRALAAAAALDDATLEEVLRRSAVSLSAVTWLETVVAPLLEEIGERWHSGELTPAHEHLASAVIRDALGWVVASFAADDDAPVMVVATPAGAQHEFGAMMVAVVAAEAGFAVRYLGPSLPAEAIAGAATQLGARAVALSVVHADPLDDALGELTRLRAALPQATQLFVGGRAADLDPARVTATGARHVDGIPSLRSTFSRTLAELSTPGTPAPG